MKSSVSHAKRLISRWFWTLQEIILPGSLRSLGGRGEKGGGNKVFLSPPPFPRQKRGSSIRESIK